MATPDHPLLRALATWAAGRDDVLAVVLLGARTPEEGTGDSVADFDVDLHVADPGAFAGEAWLEEIAPVLVAGDEEVEDGVPGRLVFFAGQQRLDLRLRTGPVPGGVETLFRRQDGVPAAREVPAAGDEPAAASPVPPVLRSLVPVFSAPDVPAWLAHYRALGFDVREGPGDGGSAVRDGLELRVVADAPSVPAARGHAYAVVDDVDALHREWAAVPGGRTTAPADRPDGTREGAHADPAGNVVRFGRARRAGTRVPPVGRT